MRSTSGKFSLSAFGRKESSRNTSADYTSAAAGGGNPPLSSPPLGQGGGYGSGPESPGREGGAGATFDGLGRKWGKSIAHQSLLPALGNKDVRALQDLISAEKGVLTTVDRLSQETSKAATALPTYGAQEGPDLQDVLTQSSTLLSHLASALQVFATHQAGLRASLKRIRERDEQLSDLRSRRRNTGSKAETAERKLAKMGPENKALPGQTELLERLRQEMRSMDTDIVNEESKLGDFKRQIMKEALSLKFGGLEELGEKMCIIGELGKLLLEEVPLEETPPGYGRAPYTGFERTENAVTEATKCLATVQFHAASTAPKAPGLPPHAPLTPIMRQNDKIAAAEEYANYPGNVASPDAHPQGSAHGQHMQGQGPGDYRLDDNPYGGMAPYGGRHHADENHAYREYGGTRAPGSQVVWQGPTDEALHQGVPTSQATGDAQGHDYEYEQHAAMERERQAELDQAQQQQRQTQSPAAALTQGPEQAAWREQASTDAPTPDFSRGPNAASEGAAGGAPWEPLNIKRGTSPLVDGNGPPQIPMFSENVMSTDIAPTPPRGSPGPTTTTDYSNTAMPLGLAPPPPIGLRAETPGSEGFHTPMGTPPTIATDIRPPSPSITSPVSATTPGGKISAAAFKKTIRPRPSAGEVEVAPSLPTSITGYGAEVPGRRLPAPPGGVAQGEGHAGPTQGTVPSKADEAFTDAQEEPAPPPSYIGTSTGGDSLR